MNEEDFRDAVERQKADLARVMGAPPPGVRVDTIKPEEDEHMQRIYDLTVAALIKVWDEHLSPPLPGFSEAVTVSYIASLTAGMAVSFASSYANPVHRADLIRSVGLTADGLCRVRAAEAMRDEA